MSGDKVCQRIKVLSALKRARSRGCTNVYLNAICFRYGGRIHELRRLGWQIETIRMSNGWFKYRLHPSGW